MRIALYQQNIVWENIDSNLEKIENILSEVSGKCDLLVLPEMFSTGFTTNPTNVSEKMSGKAVSFLIEKSKQYLLSICGSVVIEEGGKTFNRMLFVRADGQLEHYDKRHLFRMSGEDNYFSAGKEQKIINFMGFNILLQVCYDLRFPVWSRNVNNAYDMAIYVASWPIPRIKVWDTLLHARALENQCFVVGVNRVGEDPAVKYNGGSRLIDFLGRDIAKIDDDTEDYVICEIEKEKLNAFREKFPAYLDADNFNIKI